MKNSVWYHKLWREKLNKLEIKESSDAAWEGMKSTLDQYIPADMPLAGSSAVSVVSKIWKLIGYIVPTIAVISTVAYVYVSEKKNLNLYRRRQRRYMLILLSTKFTQKMKGIGQRLIGILM